MGIRVIKTAAAVLISIYIAQALGLPNPLAAGLLAVLGVDVTIKRGLRTSSQRIVASVFGLFCAMGLFWSLGFHIWVIGVYILILYPLLSRLQLKEGIVTSSVLMLHVFAAGEINTGLLYHEVLLLLIGLGTATLVNILYMPRDDEQLRQYRQRVEGLFSLIFTEISHHLRDNQYVWSGEELIQADRNVREAVLLAERASENSLMSGRGAWTVYFYMREQQLLAIERMVQQVARVYQTLPHGELLASVFDDLREDVLVEHYTGRSEKKLAQLEDRFKGMPLPQTREEFEVRASLLQLVEELKVYLAVARREKRPAEGTNA